MPTLTVKVSDSGEVSGLLIPPQKQIMEMSFDLKMEYEQFLSEVAKFIVDYNIREQNKIFVREENPGYKLAAKDAALAIQRHLNNKFIVEILSWREDLVSATKNRQADEIRRRFARENAESSRKRAVDFLAAQDPSPATLGTNSDVKIEIELADGSRMGSNSGDIVQSGDTLGSKEGSAAAQDESSPDSKPSAGAPSTGTITNDYTMEIDQTGVDKVESAVVLTSKAPKKPATADKEAEQPPSPFDQRPMSRRRALESKWRQEIVADEAAAEKQAASRESKPFPIATAPSAEKDASNKNAVEVDVGGTTSVGDKTASKGPLGPPSQDSTPTASSPKHADLSGSKQPPQASPPATEKEDDKEDTMDIDQEDRSRGENGDEKASKESDEPPSLPDSMEQAIVEHMPSHASSIVYIFDRRVNLDAHPADATVYSLIRSWIQDDPDRVHFPNDANVVLRFSDKPTPPLVKHEDPPIKFSSDAATYRQQLVDRGKARRKARARKRRQDDREALTRLQSRGIDIK